MKDKLFTLRNFYLYFMMYSVFGWLYEVLLEVVVYRWGFSNRGVLFGPYCPIYGTGALIFIICLSKLKEKEIKIWKINITPLFIFLGIILIATALELAGSYIMEAITGSWMWDYTRFNPNFQGRIALNPSIRFGIGGMVFMYILQPLFEKLCNRKSKALNIISISILIIFISDFVYTFFIK